MSCFSELDSQIATLLAVPHEILLLRHKVFREYAKVAVGTDFVHTLPSFLIVTAAVLVLWRYPPSSKRLYLVGATCLYKSFQVSVSWLMINAFLWLWLILQRVLYCSVWHYWSYDFEYRHMSYPWWQRVWSSYYSPRAQPPVMSADFVSWIIAMTIAVTALGCALSMDHVQAFVSESLLPKFRNAFTVTKSCTKWTRNRTQDASPEEDSAMEISQVGSVCDDNRSKILTDANGTAREDVHPVSYGTNWMPQPNLSVFKESQRNSSIRSLQTMVGNVNNVQDPDKFTGKPLRPRRACHTVAPNYANDQSSDC